MTTKTRPISVCGIPIGIGFVVIAGPCSIESQEQLSTIAGSIKSSGAQMLRGGIFKMRTDPKSFQGLGKDAFAIAQKVKNEIQIPLVSEVTDPRQISDMHEIVDVFQVGSRNMYNYSLLKELGMSQKPILLKRGFSALLEEWIHAAEYIMNAGNENVILCERGIRAVDNKTRNTLDLNAVAWIKHNYHLPIIVDPSHAVGVRELIPSLALAAAAAGADGLLVEVHNDPNNALSDGFQALTLDDFEKLMGKIKSITKITHSIS